MKTSDLIKQAEELLGKCSDGPWKIVDRVSNKIIKSSGSLKSSKTNTTYDGVIVARVPLTILKDNEIDAELIVFARNHMQELLDRLKRYEGALVRLACYDEQSSFDEPGSVTTAREALEEV